MGLIYAALLIWGIKCLFSEGFILHFKRDSWPSWIRKPLFDCPPCMASVWGTIWFVCNAEFTILAWISFCIMLCGLNYLLIEILYDDN